MEDMDKIIKYIVLTGLGGLVGLVSIDYGLFGGSLHPILYMITSPIILASTLVYCRFKPDKSHNRATVSTN